MKIESITLRELHMPLVHFFETSFGRTTERRVLLVEMQVDGITGWGECVAGEHPYYSEESIETAWYALHEELGPAMLGCTLESGREVPARLLRVRGHRMAKAALENAVWDAESQLKRVPLWKLLGGSRNDIACGVSLGIQDSPEQLLEKVETELAAGYQRIKVKCKPGWDLDILRRIRQRWPGILLSCDANSAYTLKDSEHLKRFDEFNLLMIEQPLWNDDFYFHAALQKQLKTRICLDEAIHHARSAQAAIELGSCGIINIKVGRVGGFSEAVAVHDVALRNNIPVWCGGMLESGIGRSHNVALSTLPGFSLPGDVSASARYWKEDVIEPDVVVSQNGTIKTSNEPGRGYAVKRELIERLTIRKKTMQKAAAVQI
ncbi:MAG: o-succinylbenzoate synthase [Acidobacteria bacterium]|nr:o-succinylbenzoate synthase [Acidobacteriota bacterium]MBV9144958.1 o-succinylbenzoate synthase [Acidobacteriota bacterium]